MAFHWRVALQMLPRTSQVVFEKKLVRQAELEKWVMDLMGEEGWVAQIQV